MREFWLHDERGLDQIAALVAREFRFELAGDSTSRHRWFVGRSAELRLIFNLSCKRPNGRVSDPDPLRISVRGPVDDDATLAGVGARLATCLGARVAFGEVAYQGGDRFRYLETTEYRPAP